MKETSRFIEPTRTKNTEINYRNDLEHYCANSIGTNVEKMQNFCKYVPTQDVRKFICRTELFKKILNIQGSIIECGVLFGGGLMSWAHLSEIFEPINHLRKIIGFDTFQGFVNIDKKDETSYANNAKIGGLCIDSYDDLLECIKIYDTNRLLNHIDKIRIIKGDIKNTLSEYIKKNPYLIVSLLYLDFDIYEPTIETLNLLLPRIPKGGIIAFDELNHEVWPGETIAVMETMGISNLKLQRFEYGPTMSYVVME